jgi:N-acetylmuramoyl-L-alanine amidase
MTVVVFLFWPFCGVVAGAAVSINGVRYIGLESVAERLGMDRKWVQANREIVLYSDWTRLEFNADDRYFDLNGTRVYLAYPVALRGADLYICESDFEAAVRPILTPQVHRSVPRLYRVVIDPGHGGKDPGARGAAKKLKEKDLALDISRRLQAKLAARGYSVSLTRDGDEFVKLGTRAAIANRLRADLFLSIHLNAVGTTSVAGVETYAFTPAGQPSTRSGGSRPADEKRYPGNRKDPWNALIGYYVQSELVKSLGARDRGLKRARWEVLKTLNCPGLLIETGFLTNPGEAQKMKDSRYRDKIADAIAQGVYRYQKTLNRIRGLSSK